MSGDDNSLSIDIPGNSDEKMGGKGTSNKQTGTSMYSTPSETISGPIVEQYNYRTRGYAGCSNPCAGFVLCTMACIIIIVLFFVFYPRSTTRQGHDKMHDAGGHHR